MSVLLLVVTAVVLVLVAAVTIGKVTNDAARRPRQSVYDLEEAVEFVADRLPADLQARLTHDDVRAVLGWHLDFLQQRGFAYQSETTLTADQSVGVEVAGEDEMLAYVLGQVSSEGMALDDLDVVEIIEAQMAYMVAIGAIGPQVPDPGDLPGDL